MKKLIIIISLVMLQASSTFALTPMPRIPPAPGTWTPPSMPCITNKIIIDKSIDGDSSISLNRIRNVFTNYEDPSRGYLSSSGRYELCFEFVGFESTGGALPVNEPLLFIKAVDSKSVYIKGLKLTQGSAFPSDAGYLLTVSNHDTAPAASVILEGIELSNVNYGLHLVGKRIELTNSTVTGEGVGSDTAGRENEACLLIQGNDKKIKHSVFTNCYSGIALIEAENAFIGAENETKFGAEANDIHDNKIGIHYLSNQNNRFPFNRIYNNVKAAGAATSDDAIFFDPVMLAIYEAVGLEIPKRPEIVLLGSATDPEQALHCDKDDAGRVVQRWIQFREGTFNSSQEMIIYQTNVISENNQAERYFAKCTVNEDGKCIIVFPSLIDPSKCGLPDLYAVALMNDINYTSMITPRSFKLDGPVVALGTGPMIEIPDSAPGVAGGPPVTELESSEESSGSEFAGTGSAVEGGAPISSAGPGGGCMTLMPLPAHKSTVGFGITLWWLIFAAPAAIIAVRIKRRK